MKTAQKFMIERGLGDIRLAPNYSLSDLLKEYATEAIKADRERVVNIKIEHGDSFILPKYEKDCILNLPIELP